MYLGHGLRRPNFVPKFGASVKDAGPYGWVRKEALVKCRGLPDDSGARHGVLCSKV